MSYPILMKQRGSDHMSRGRSRAIGHIVEHYSGALASARNNAVYFARNERQGASAHFFVGDLSEEICQSVIEGDTAWYAGDWDMNCRPIGIEIISAGEDFSEAEIARLPADPAPAGEVRNPRRQRDPPLRRDGQALPCALYRLGQVGSSEGAPVR